MKLSRVGIDLAKNVYQLHGVDRTGKTMLKRRQSSGRPSNTQRRSAQSLGDQHREQETSERGGSGTS
jgi:hypothetical protein